MDKIEELAYKIAHLLEKHNCHKATLIYFNNKRLEYEDYIYRWVEKDGYSPDYCMKYYNLDTITMSFEGNFYDAINYLQSLDVVQEFNALVESYGYDYDFGDSWNLALYAN